MTTPEHTLVGMQLALALNLPRFLGWQSLVVAGLASNLPDWDGLPMLLDMQRFESGHRVWGHNVLGILLTSVVFAWTISQWNWIDRWFSHPASKIQDSLKLSQPIPVRSSAWNLGTCVLLVIAVQLIHLPCDMVVSGGQGLSAWPVRPWWPFLDQALVFPMIPWGDVGPTIILMLGLILSARFPDRSRQWGRLSLLGLVIYLFARNHFSQPV